MLSDQLSQQLEYIHALQSVLDEETACLKEKNFTQLTAIISKKQQLLVSITELDKSLATPASQKAIIEDNDLIVIKSDIEQKLTKCKKSNSINGQIIERSMKSNKHLMQIMKQVTGKNSVTYDRKGGLNSASLMGKDIKA
jgi:flagella synthesis protein FlgN